MTRNPAEYLEHLRQAWEAGHPPFRNQGWLTRPEVLWEDHFREFSKAHGGLPVFHAGRLLFEDGWGHALDPEGPKYPPPADATDRLRLRRAYWKLRRNAVARELPPTRLALAEAERLVDMAGGVPLMYRTWRWDPEGGEQGAGAYAFTDRPVEELATDLAQRLRWLEEDLALCDRRAVDPDCPDEAPVSQALDGVAAARGAVTA